MLIKFCGMRLVENLEFAASLGVNICGFIFYKNSPRYLSPDQAAMLPSFGMLRAGVFVNQRLDEIMEISKIAKLDLIQLHGDQDVNCALSLGSERVIRVVWPERFGNMDELNEHLEKLSSSSAMFLLDAGKSSGGSGKTLDREYIHRLESPKPWILAGGISPENVQSCLSTCHPDGLDVNSGIEAAPGQKDPGLMAELYAALRNFQISGDGK